MATLNSVRDALRAQPFESFDLVLLDGRRYTVPHPDFAMFPPVERPRGIFVFTLGDFGPGSYRTHKIDLGLITEVVIPSQQPAAPPATP
jgi:hypothetical protein